jgi:hypothetical protein
MPTGMPFSSNRISPAISRVVLATSKPYTTSPWE